MMEVRWGMRRILIGAGIVVVVVIALAIAGLKALEAGAGKDRIASALSSALGQPVTIGALSISLFPSPSIEARNVTIGSAARDAAPGVSVTSLRVVPRLATLLPGRQPTISHVDLDGLVVAVRRTATGKWLVPVPPVGAAPPTSASTPHAASASGASVDVNALTVRNGTVRVVDDSLRTASGGPTITAIDAIGATMRVSGGALTMPQFTGRLGHTTVSGSLDAGTHGITLHLSAPSIENADLPALFALAGMIPYPGLSIGGKAPVDITVRVAPDLATFSADGKAAIDRVSLGTITLQALDAPFRLAKGVLTLDPIRFTAYQGKETGTVTVNIATTPPSYTIRTSISGLDVQQALGANTTMKDVLLGTAALQADVRGSGTTAAAIERSLSGTVHVNVTDGVLRHYPLLSALNQALGITGGTMSDTKFESLSGSASIAGGVARTNDLLLHAGDLTMHGAGTLGLDQSIDLQLTADFSAARSAQLAQSAAIAKRLENAQGELEVPMTVRGTASAPKIGVNVQSIAKQQLQDQIKKGLGKLFTKP